MMYCKDTPIDSGIATSKEDKTTKNIELGVVFVDAVFEHRHRKSNENPFLITYPFPREIKNISGKLYPEVWTAVRD